MKRKFDDIIGRRIGVVLLFFFMVLAVLAGRVFMLDIVQYREYSNLASRQQQVTEVTLSERGTIYAQDKNNNLIPLALNESRKTLIASPKNIKEPEKVAEFLTQTFKLKKEDFIAKFSKKDDPYEIIIKNISLQDADKISLPEGLFWEDVKQRVYPYNILAAALLGFVAKDKDEDVGRYGLERFYNSDLVGEKGFFEGVKDTAGFWVALGRRIIQPPKNGAKVVLTINYDIQAKAEEVLSEFQKKWDASSGSVVVVEPSTGRILALATRPAFDPNNYSKEKDFSVFLNPIVESRYELGSVVKPITLAAGIEEKVVTPDTIYNDTGEVKIGGRHINNFDNKAHGVQTMTQVLEKSLNTGAVFVAGRLGQNKQYEYLKRFGFNEKTGIDLGGEIAGNISNLDAGRPIDFATASFGQGISITPLELIMAMSAIANKGELMRPYMVDKIIDSSGNEKIKNPQSVRRVISENTAETISQMLVSAANSGFEKRATVKGYFIAGKTGTAQIPKKDGPGYSDKVIHSFVGYAPAFNPKFLIFFQLNEPKGNLFAANTLSPAFHNLAEFILNYYEVPPDEK